MIAPTPLEPAADWREQLRLYRTRHVIDPVRPAPWDRIREAESIVRCKVDGIRIIQRRSGARPLLWRHDPDTIRRLARLERGETP